MDDPENLETVVEVLEGVKFNVVVSLGSAGKKLAWGIESFGEVFEMMATDYGVN
jgi:hypothetical protein